MKEPKYINATMAYRKYGIARSLLRELAYQKKVRMVERDTGGVNMLKLYDEEDIIRFINGR